MAISSPVMIWMTDAGGNIVFVNNAYLKFFGIELRDLVHLDWKALVHPDDFEHYVGEFVKATSNRSEFRCRTRARRADGEWRWISSYGSPYFSADGEFLGMVGSSPDITEQVNAEEALRESEARFRIALQHSPIIVYTTDRELRYTWIYNVHPAYRAEEVLGRRDDELLPAEKAAPLMELKRRVLATGLRERSEYELELQGRRYVYEMNVEPLVDEAGETVGVRVAAAEITRRKRLEEELRRADRQKEEFLAILSHELRNPLSPMRNAVELLRRGGAEHVPLVRDIMDRQLSHLIRLVDDLLDVSRLQAGKIELRREPISLHQVLEAALEATAHTMEEARHDVCVRLPSEPVVAFADRVRLCQAVVNLLNNAAKFTPQGGKIDLELSAQGGQATILVRDNGIGVPPEHLERIFAMFEQLQPGTERTGLGVGLALSKRLVEMHGGRIEARSKGTGFGSEFAIHLPVGAIETQAEKEPAESTGMPRTVMVVDDNKDNADTLALLLQADGHRVVTVYSGEDALQVAERVHPAVVLLDIGMPGMDGYEAVRVLRKRSWARDARFYAISGWAQEGDRKRAADAGFDGHLAKPISYDDMRKVLSDR